MRKLEDYFTPEFLTRLDKYLMVHHPLLFASRVTHVLFYNLLILGFALLVIWLPPIRVFRMPDTNWILLGYFLIAASELVIWVYYQRLLDIVYYHGSGDRFYSLKAMGLFFFVFLMTSQLVALPYLYINTRISKTFTESRLPPPRLFMTPTNPFNPQVDTLAFLNSSCSIADTSAVEYSGLPAKAQDDVVFCMGRNLFWNFFALHFGRDSTGPWAHCAILKKNQAPADSLLVYYRSLSGVDSFYSDSYNRMIYSGRVSGRIIRGGVGQPKDTSIRRFYFYSAIKHKIVSSDSGDIQLRLLTEQILEQDVFMEDTTAAERLETVETIENQYLYASLEAIRWQYILYSAAYYGCMLAMLVLFVYSFIRFFGLDLFLISLSVPVIFLCTLAFRNTFRDLLSEVYTGFLWSLLSLVVLLPLIRRRRFVEIFCLQLICYIILVILIRFPFEMFHPAPTEFHIPDSRVAIMTPLLWLFIPIPGAILLSTLLFEKLCHLYVRPEG